MPSANLAILFANVPDSAERTARQTLDESEHLTATRAALIGPLFKGFGGRVVKAMGDGYLVVFRSPTQALMSAIAVQDRLWHHNHGVSLKDQMALRIAINVGEVRQDSGDVFGEPVNIAARVLGLAAPGEVYFTEALHLSMAQAEVRSEELGAFELKGIPGKVRVFRVAHAPSSIELPERTQTSSAFAEGAPFGDLGLSRLAAVGGDGVFSIGALVVAAGDTAAPALQRGKHLAESIWHEALSTLARYGRTQVALTAIAATLALGFVVHILGGSEAERAIQAVAHSIGSARDPLAEHARDLIAKVVDTAERDYLSGALHEALGEASQSVVSYEASARAGHSGAQAKIVDLLNHPSCRVRVAAASAASELRLRRARTALERLAKNGGPNEGGDIPLIGCNSRRAARDALQRLEP